MAFEVQGHRGARGLYPENSVAGFRAAVALGVDALELDVAITADDEVVVFHDVALGGDLVRGPDGTWLEGEPPTIRSLTAAELSRYDIGRIRPGSAYAAAHPAQQGRDGIRIPTLAQVFAATAPVRLDVELKTLPNRPDTTVSPEHMAERVLEVTADALDRLDIRSFDWRGVRHARKLRPGLRVTLLTEPKTVAAAALWWGGRTMADHDGSVARAVAAEAPGCCWAPLHTSIARADIEEAHALGLRVVPWTVNDPAEIARFRAWGADGICTDRPDLARA
jgi:glycerophosphoryl diester phosphodiesterase